MDTKSNVVGFFWMVCLMLKILYDVAAFSISSIAFHVVVRSKNWLNKAREKIKQRDELSRGKHGKHLGSSKEENPKQKNNRPISIQTTNVPNVRIVDPAPAQQNLPPLEHINTTAGSTVGRQLMNLLCCCQSNTRVVPHAKYLNHHSPTSPSSPNSSNKSTWSSNSSESLCCKFVDIFVC